MIDTAAPHLITVEWQEITIEEWPYVYHRWGKDEHGVIYSSGDLGGIRGGEFIGTGTARNAIVYIKNVRMVVGASEANPLQFSPDGEHWFQTENLPEVSSGWAQIRGAVWNGNDILIVANYQYEPWKYKTYVARVTPEDLKRASQ